MKYAYIAIIVIYLITYGCSPDKVEEKAASHGDAPPATVETPHQEEKTPAAVHQQEPVEQAHVEQKATAEMKHEAPADTEKHAAAIEEPVTEEIAPENQWETIAKSAGVTVAALMKADSKTADTKTVEQPIAEKPVVEKQEAVKTAGSEQVVMPCGKMMAKKDIPAGAPCATMQKPASADSQDLTVAMQKIVEATNDMVMVTRQLVIATQAMLDASKEAAVETTGTDKK